MITLDCAQGSPEWIKARIGIPTASDYDKILTAKTMRPSASAGPLLHQKIAEWMLGVSLDEAASDFIERGRDMEQECRDLYELERGVDIQRVGFIYRDDKMTGCSPDGLVLKDGLFEGKCPSARVHVGYLYGSVADDYRAQVQGQLLITGRKWCDVMSYCPGLPPAIVRVERDEKYIAALVNELDLFIGRLMEARAEMLRRGFTPRHKEAA